MLVSRCVLHPHGFPPVLLDVDSCSCSTSRSSERIATYLAGRVDDLASIVLALVADNLAKRVLDRGIVALDEVAVHKLDRERGFACGSLS